MAGVSAGSARLIEDFTVRQARVLVLVLVLVAVVARLGVTAVAAYSIAYTVLYAATLACYAVLPGRTAPWITATFGAGPGGAVPERSVPPSLVRLRWARRQEGSDVSLVRGV
ncbi:hypothetical protein J7F01_07690 [Streptomyces sp. ISL-22]|uniref:hypothetical protein n=1 Tax=unclassified Streptomyces TaxID=2593676 RepID=UPI001BEA9A6F|nr:MULTISPECIES: hypothetical protein [unclassified Streptomyces]MBT2422940.1 hypothetical protein [Streptomyces sp. ISL-24]MBT2432081.1 hypothetical protein [Streptomyces sp. ISL-22]